MGCINAEGDLSASARMLLGTMFEPVTVEEAAKRSELPLFLVRSAVREFVQAGLVREAEARYVLTDAGRARLPAKA